MRILDYVKHGLIKLLRKFNINTLIFAVGIFIILIITCIGLVKISATGGMAKAQKEAEIAYESAVQLKNKQKDKEKNTTQPQTEKEPTVSVITKDRDPEKINKYYGESVFVGDSVMLGFSDYCEYKGEGFLGDPYFLVAGSFSLYHALSDSSNAILPLFRGEKTKIEDAVSQMNDVKRIFLFFGINDFNMTSEGANGVFKKYVEFINRIQEKRNDIDINIISTTYILNGKDQKNLTNENISSLNRKMKNYCEINGYGYINIADKVGDEDSGLKPEYCSDNFLHETAAAYDIWTTTLEEFVP